MKRIVAILLVMLCLLTAVASAEVWTIMPYGTAEPISISPDGGTMLFRDEEGLLVKRNGEVRRIVPNFDRGVEDVYGNFEKYVNSTDYSYYSFDDAGVIWSPDGRYFTLTYWQKVLVQAQMVFDLIVFDTETGECFLADTDGNRPARGSASCVVAACFDESGEFLDFVRFGNHVDSRFTLERYEISSGRISRLAEFSEYQGVSSYPCVGMQRLDGERYLLIRGTDDQTIPYAFDLFQKEGKSGWQEELTPFAFELSNAQIWPRQVLAQPDAKYALVYAYMNTEANSDRTLQLFRVNVNNGYDGMDEGIVIPSIGADTAETVDISEQSFEQKATETLCGSVLITNAALSPDGEYALLMAFNRENETYHFAVLDMETLALKWVQFDEVDANRNGIYRRRSTEVNYRFLNGMQWHQDDCLLLNTEDGVKLYQLENSK